MGNSESKGESSKDPKSPQTRAASREKERHHHGQAHARQPPNSSGLANLTPSTLGATHSSALAASPSISTSEVHGHGATVSGSRSRQRSVTAGNRLRPDDIASSQKSDSSSNMGQEQSKRAPSRSSTHPPVTLAEKERPAPSPEPVQVPRPHHEDFAHTGDNTPPSGEATSPYGLPASQFDRPPRLPLPIERDPEPASPIISPTDMSSPVEGSSEGDRPHRQHSMLSSTTLDDDEEIDAETFNMEHDSSQPKQPTTIVWRHPARQVFLTGSFVDWQRKLKMQRDPDTGVFTIMLHLSPGTHHMKFLVDGEMRPSNEYPTTVDWTNALMNYLEIMPQPAGPATPMPIPGAGAGTTQTADRTAGSAEGPSGTQATETDEELASTLHETTSPSRRPAPAAPTTPAQEQQPTKPAKKQLPRPKYTRDIPEMLLHLDLYGNPDDERYQRASKAMQNLPTPPTLPMFMQKSILNATTPVKDDASVLTMPNHTILNHLATSSIRSGVLATSGTTRYKRKFLTTIMYRPTSDSG